MSSCFQPIENELVKLTRWFAVGLAFIQAGLAPVAKPLPSGQTTKPAAGIIDAFMASGGVRIRCSSLALPTESQPRCWTDILTG